MRGVPRALRNCADVGRDVVVDGPLHVEPAGRIVIGDRTVLRSAPAISHLVTARGGTLRIGCDVVIGHGAAVACHAAITIGDGAQIGPYVMLMDTDFHEAGNHDAAGGTSAIHIGAGARIGARVVVLRGSSIGAGAVVQAGSVVKGDVPAGAIVGGNPARPIGGGATDVRTVDITAICEVAGHTLGLRVPPTPETTRDAIPTWDSLGMLNLLLSLEQAFGVSIPSDAMASVARIGDLLPVVEGAALVSAG